MEKKC